MNALAEADRLQPGEAQLIENLLLSPRGNLSTRNGFLGQFTTALSGPIYLARDRYVMPDGTLRLIFASGSPTAKLYSYKPGDAAPVEILKSGGTSFAFTAAGINVRFAQHGRYGFLLDGGDSAGAIWRVDVGTGAQAISLSGLATPTDAPTAELSFKVLNALAPGDWAVDTLSNANVNLCSNPRFNGADNSGTDLGDYWKIIAGTPKGFDTSGVAALPALAAGEKWLRLDDPGDVVCLALNTDGSTPYLDNGYAENVKWSSSSSFRRWCHRFLFKCRAVITGSTAKAFHVRIQFFSDATTPSDTVVPLYEYDFPVTLSAEGKDELVRTLIDVSPYVTGSVRYIRLFLLPDTTSSVTTDGPYITDVELQAVHPYWDVPSPALSEAGFIPIGDDVNILAGLYVAYNASGTIDATGLDQLALTLSTPAVFTPRPAIEFKFQDASGNIWTSPTTILGEAIKIDITEMPAAMKAAIDRFALVFLEDSTVTGLTKTRTPASTRCAFYINDLVVPGALAEGIPYSYLYSDFDADGSVYLDGGHESSGSPDSASVTPGGVNGRVNVTIPLAFSPAGDNFLIWRRGGIRPDSDTRPALAAMVPVSADASGDGWSWNHTTRVFTDNIPDEDLWFAESYQINRDAPPTGARCLISHAQRLFVGRFDTTRKVNEVYVSWLLDGGTDAGYYFSNLVDPDDPESEIKGALLRQGSTGDGDRINAFASLIPPAYTGDMLSAHLLVMREDGPPSTLTGWRGGVNVTGAFSLLAATEEVGGGCIAPQSAEQIQGRVWWAAATGLVTLAGGNIQPVADPIKPLLSLEPLGPTRYPQVFLLWHDRQVWALVPGTSSADGWIYLWDEQVPNGSKWVKLSYSVGFVSAVSLSGGKDSGQLYLGGRNGQLFLYTGTIDKATPALSAVPITFALSSRRYGQADAGPVAFFAPSRAQSIQLEVECGATLALSGSVTGDNSATRAFTWNAPAGISQPLIRNLGDVRGTTHQIDLTGSASTRTILSAVSLMTTETAIKR